MRDVPTDLLALVFASGGDHFTRNGLCGEQTRPEQVDFEVDPRPLLAVERSYSEVDDELISRDVPLFGSGFYALPLTGIDPDLLGKCRGHGVVSLNCCSFGHEFRNELAPLQVHSSNNSPGGRPQIIENGASGAARKMNALIMERMPGSNQFATLRKRLVDSERQDASDFR